MTIAGTVVDWSCGVSESALNGGIGVVENTGPLVPSRGSGVSGEGSTRFKAPTPLSAYALVLHFLPNTSGQSVGISLPLSSVLLAAGAALWGGDSSDSSLMVL